MDLCCGVEQQVLKGRMQVLAHHQGGLGCNQCHVRGRLIPRQIRHASGHDHLVEKRIERDERVGVGKAGKRNVLVGEELLYHRRAPGVHHERNIDLSCRELFRGFARAERQQCAAGRDW